MKNIVRLAAVAVIVSLFGAAQAPAQKKECTPPSPEAAAARKELRESLAGWARTNVVPQLSRWKSQLDGAMSAEDLQALNALRARAASLKKETRDAAAALHQARKSKDEAAMEQGHQKLEGLREQRRELLQGLKPLALKYRSTLEAIGEDAKPYIATWKDEGKAIVKSWYEQHKEEIGSRDLRHMGGMMRHWSMGRDLRRKAMVARFMLWNGEDFTREMDDAAPEGTDTDMPELE